jgi:enamine deaminase RidA (YjgF/YER057c/UK114 family)
MKMKTIRSAAVRDPAPRTWSNAKVVGSQFFVSGMTAHDGQGHVEGDGSMYDQALRTFGKIRHLVEAAGAKMDDIVRLDIYVTDIAQRKEVWRAREQFFSGDFPCSTLVEVKALAIPALLVEINATGFIGASEG